MDLSCKHKARNRHTKTNKPRSELHHGFRNDIARQKQPCSLDVEISKDWRVDAAFLESSIYKAKGNMDGGKPWKSKRRLKSTQC